MNRCSQPALRKDPPGDALCASTSRDSIRFARLCASSDFPLLLTGETGSGKTHVARLIHHLSARARSPFVRVNCGAIPEQLFEREMFGHIRGAFTGSHDGGPGYLEAADGGTLFLDEVGELPMSVQSKLLSVLEDGAFRRLGSIRESTVDVRVIAATNRDISAMLTLRSFREDLFYRLSVLRYRVPPLRECADAIPALARAILERYSPDTEIGDDAMDLLCAYAWPGNIRELENVLRAGLVFAAGGTIMLSHLPPELRSGGRAPAGRYASPPSPEAEHAMIEAALAACGGNKTRAARSLGMARSTLWAKLRHHSGCTSPTTSHP